MIQRSLAAWRIPLAALAASGLGVALLIGRVQLGAGPLLFLVWNLFLAWLPYLFGLGTVWAARAAWRRPLLLILGPLWLAFLPNTIYLVTDLIHLSWLDFVLWYDAVTLFTFSWAGCLLSVAALRPVADLIWARWGAAVGATFVLVVAGLCGIGIYLGRFLRWNSWDLLFSPRSLAGSLLDQLADPAALLRLVAVSGLFAALLLVIYMTFAGARRGEGVRG